MAVLVGCVAELVTANGSYDKLDDVARGFAPVEETVWFAELSVYPDAVIRSKNASGAADEGPPNRESTVDAPGAGVPNKSDTDAVCFTWFSLDMEGDGSMEDTGMGSLCANNEADGSNGATSAVTEAPNRSDTDFDESLGFIWICVRAVSTLLSA